MNLSEFARRARMSRLQKKARFEAELERSMRDLQLSDTAVSRARRTPHSFIRNEPNRPILTLFPRQQSATGSCK
jgi:hypothetical protein